MDCLDPFQSDFRPSYGTETALVTLVNDLWRKRYMENVFVLLVISAAFYTTNHGTPLDCLSGMWLGGIALQWLWFFLDRRTWRVVLRDSCPTTWLMTCGVPQDSVLSSMLFSIYMNLLCLNPSYEKPIFHQERLFSWSHHRQWCVWWGYGKGSSLLLLPESGTPSHRRPEWPHLCCTSVSRQRPFFLDRLSFKSELIKGIFLKNRDHFILLFYLWF